MTNAGDAVQIHQMAELSRLVEEGDLEAIEEQMEVNFFLYRHCQAYYPSNSNLLNQSKFFLKENKIIQVFWIPFPQINGYFFTRFQNHA
jgi:hypothetical protein